MKLKLILALCCSLLGLAAKCQGLSLRTSLQEENAVSGKCVLGVQESFQTEIEDYLKHYYNYNDTRTVYYTCVQDFLTKRA